MNEMMTRREMLKLSGLTALAIGAVMSGGLGARAATAGVFSAGEGLPYEAWQSLQPGADPRTLVAAAILAANPHNTQPWRFRLASAGIVVDGRRVTRAARVRPYRQRAGRRPGLRHREHLSGRSRGRHGHPARSRVRRWTVDRPGRAFPRGIAGGGGPLCRHPPEAHQPWPLLDGAAGANGDAGAGGSATRHAVPGSVVMARGRGRDRFGTLVNDATAAIIADRGQSEESDRWWRAGRDDLERYRDGLTLDAQGLPATTVFVAKILPRTSRTQNDQTWLKNTREVHVKTASAFGLLSVQDAVDPLGRLEVGRAYQRLHLWATLHGLAMHPMNQVTERIYRDRSLGTEPAFAPKLAELTPAGRTTLFAFRIGFPEVEPGISPRRRLEDVIDG